jgi:hypothetical protein
MQLKRLILAKKAELSGGRWVTITKDGPLHGRHIYISSNGTILAGKVPKQMHGKNLSELSTPHKEEKAMHDHYSQIDDKGLKNYHEQNEERLTKFPEGHAGHKNALKHKAIIEHYQKVLHAKNTPHSQMVNAHENSKSLTIEDLQDKIKFNELAIEHYAKSKDAKAIAYHEKLITIAEHHLKMKQDAEPKEELKVEVKREVPTVAPHTSKQPIHNTFSVKTPAELKSIIKDAKAKIADGSATSFDKKKLKVAAYYLNGGQKPIFDKKVTDAEVKAEPVLETSKVELIAPHMDKEALHKAYADRTPEDLQDSIEKNTKTLEDMKKIGQEDSVGAIVTQRRIDVAKYYLAGGKLPDFESLKEKAKEVSKPHPQESFKHDQFAKMGPDELMQYEGVAINKMKNPKGKSDYDAYKKNLEILQYQMKEKGMHVFPAPDYVDPHAQAHVAMDDFNNPSHQVSTNVDNAGKNIKDLGIDYKDSSQLHKWHEKIDHHSQNFTASEMKSKADHLTELMTEGTHSWGKTNDQADKAKANGQKKLVDALKDNPQFMKLAKAVKPYNSYANTPAGRESLATDAMRDIISEWASSSGDSNTLSVGMQLAAKEEFGLEKSYTKFETHTMKGAHDKYLSDPDIKAGMKAFLRTQYNHTQEFLKDAGITHLPIIRGMSFADNSPVDHIEFNTPTKAKMQLQPLSSFSSSATTAEYFTGTVTGGKGKIRVLTAAMIPVERIMGCVQTGFGCMSEKEFIVLGGGKALDDTVSFVWDHYGEGKKEFTNTDMFKHLADSKFDGKNTSEATVDASGGHEKGSAFETKSNKTVAMNAKAHAKNIHNQMKSKGDPYYPSLKPKDNLYSDQHHHYDNAMNDIQNSKDFTAKAKEYHKAKGQNTFVGGLTDAQKSEFSDHVLHQAANAHHENTTGVKQEKKNYHVAYQHYNNGWETKHMEAVNAKQVENAHGLDLFAHKVNGGYKVSEGSTGVAFTGTFKTQKKAIEIAHYKIKNNSKEEIEAKLADKPKVPDHLLKKNDGELTTPNDLDTHDDEGSPIIYPDQDLHNADWTKQSWDLPPYGSDEFNEWLKRSNYSLDQFKKTPCYMHMMEKKRLAKSEDYPNEEYYPSDRYAYKTNAKNVHYIPINRIKTPYQTEKALDKYKIKSNRLAMRRGEALEPCVIGYNYDLHDGHHRLEAAKSMGHTHLPCIAGGRNERRVIAAKRRYSAVYKSIVSAGKLLIKKATAPKGGAERWVTIRGTHVQINGQGEILKGPDHMQGKNLSSVIAEKSGPHQDKQGHHNNYAKAGNKYLDHHKADAVKRADEAKESGNKEKHRDQKARIAIIDHYKSLTDGSDWQSKMKTPFDTKAIVEARANAKAQVPTYKRSYYHSAERKALRESIIRELYGTGAKNKNRRIDLVIGPPAAGKSTALADPLAAEHGSLIIDSDMAKERLPEFDGGMGAGIVQEESSVMIESFGGLIDRAMANGDNIVLPLVGRDAEKIIKMQKDLHAAGYEVHLHLNEVPKEESTKRAIDRFYSQQRFVDPDYVYNVVGNKPSSVYEELKKHGGFHSYEKVSNDVEKGQKPKLIERIGAGEKGTAGYTGGGSGKSVNGSNVSSVPETQKVMAKSLISKAGKFLIRSVKK